MKILVLPFDYSEGEREKSESQYVRRGGKGKCSDE
jgi:hypothetical protein